MNTYKTFLCGYSVGSRTYYQIGDVSFQAKNITEFRKQLKAEFIFKTGKAPFFLRRHAIMRVN